MTTTAVVETRTQPASAAPSIPPAVSTLLGQGSTNRAVNFSDLVVGANFV